MKKLVRRMIGGGNWIIKSEPGGLPKGTERTNGCGYSREVSHYLCHIGVSIPPIQLQFLKPVRCSDFQYE